MENIEKKKQQLRKTLIAKGDNFGEFAVQKRIQMGAHRLPKRIHIMESIDHKRTRSTQTHFMNEITHFVTKEGLQDREWEVRDNIKLCGQ